MHTRPSEITDWLRERLTAAGARGYVVALGGGLEAAVVARLCQLAAPDHVIALLVDDDAGARAAADHFGIPAISLDLGGLGERMTGELDAAVARLPAHHQRHRGEDADRAARGARTNVGSRLRMTSLYFVANALDYLVAGTGNRCDLTVGSFTKHGDGAADVLPLGDLLASDVRGIARDLALPESLLSEPADGAATAGRDGEEGPGFSDQQLERYLAGGPEAVPPATALRIERLVRQTAHKRRLAPTPATTAEPAEFPE